MRTIGSPAELERRRFLALERVSEGFAAEEVADFLGVDPSSVRRWVAAFHGHGAAGLATRPVPGRPPKLTTTQEKIALRWLADNPTGAVLQAPPDDEGDDEDADDAGDPRPADEG